MRIAPVAEVKAKFSAFLNQTQTGPVIITKNGKPIAAMLAVKDEQQLLRLLLDYAPQIQIELGRVWASQGLVVALELLTKEIAAKHPVSVHLAIDRNIETLLSRSAQEVLLSLIAEAVANAAKHAQANNLTVRVYERDQRVIAEIEDDGVGFDVAQVEAANVDARIYQDQRAALVNGTTAIQSAPGEGTTVTVTIPIDAIEPTVS